MHDIRTDYIPNQECSDHPVWQGWLVCLVAAFFFFYELMQVMLFNSLAPVLMPALKVNAVELGHISAHYSYANLCFIFFAGMILDRFSTRRLIMVAMLLSILSTIALSQAHTQLWASISRFVTGIGGAFCLLSCLRLASRWFKPSQMAAVVGCVVTVAMLGGVVAQTPFVWLMNHFGWRHALLVVAACGFVMLIMIAIVVRDQPPHAKKVDVAQKPRLVQMFKLTIRNPQNWFAGLYTSLMNLPIFILGAIWGNMYLTAVHNLTMHQASVVSSMLFYGMIIGSPAVGWFSDRIGKRKSPMVIAAVLILAVMLVVMYVPGISYTILIFLFFLLGFLSSVQILSYPLIAESNPLELTGSAEGLASTLIIAGMLTQPLVGWLLEINNVHKVVSGLPNFSANHFTQALLILPIAFIVSVIAALFIKETYCKRQLQEV